MASEDPFFAVKDDVQKMTETAKALYHRWNELVNDPRGSVKEEFDWTTNELRNSLRSIEWDLEDLEETISIVEKNPKKFKIDGSEVNERRQFIEQKKAFVKDLKDHLASPKSRTNAKDDVGVRQSLLRNSGPDKPMSKYTRLDNDVESANGRFIEDVQSQQQLLIKQQDDQLETIGSSVRVLKDMSHQIGSELDEQSVMLDDFAREMETTETKMDSVMKKVAKVLHMSNDRRQWIAIGVLLLIMLIIIVLFFVL